LSDVFDMACALAATPVSASAPMIAALHRSDSEPDEADFVRM
jgi:hypothetical protein